ncbi:alpha/beta fold hydrolase [Streptomyces decoyicus]
MPYAVTADGVHIAYQIRGSGEWLVLLAGQANSHRWWDGVRDDFHATRRTITLDYRGTGESGKPDRPYSTQGFADDVVAVLDDLGVERADVYGTSMGGRVAQWLAVRHPHRVRALVLGCSSPGGRYGIERSDAVRRSLSPTTPAEAEGALLCLMYTPSWLANHPGPYNTLGDATMPPYARRRHLAASNHHDAWDVLPDIAAPTLVLHGTHDQLNPAANAPLLADRIPGAEMQMIDGARHAYFEEFRETASGLVLDFLG